MKSMMSDDAEMDDLYASGEPKAKGAKPESVDQEEAEESENTAIVPTKVLQGKHPEPPKEGDEIVLKVVKVYGDETEVAYSETPAGEIGKEGPSADEEIDSMEKQNPGGSNY